MLGSLGPQDADETVQSRIGILAMPEPLVSFDALGNLANVSVPDSVGDVGPNHYVAMSNVSFAVFDKTGNLLAGPALNSSLWTGFGGPCEDEDAGDPIVFYDQFADRWILTQFTAAGPEFFNCLAISTGPDPTGTFFRYAFSNGTRFPDYPKYGVWRDGYYLSTRDFEGSPDGPFAGIGAHALNRAQIIAGDPAAQIVSFFVPPSTSPFLVGDGLLPADLDGSTLPPAGTPAFFLGAMDDGGPHGAPDDALTVWQFLVNFSNPGLSQFSMANLLSISPYDTIFPCASSSTRACIPQRGTTRRIDILSYRQRPVWRFVYRRFATHDTMLASQSVHASSFPNVAGIRWWEIRGGTSPFIFQEGTFAPGVSDAIHRWMGSLAMDRDGNIALGYSASNGSTFPGIRYTGRLAGDDPGTMPQGEGLIVAGTGSITGTSRWGDYSSMNVDPVDDCTFWYVNQYVPVTSALGWKTRVGAFKFPTCGVAGHADLAVSTIEDPPAVLTLGQSFLVSDSTQNLGAGSSQPTTTRFYFSTDAVKSAGDTQLIGTRPIPAILPSAGSLGEVTLRVPGMLAGTYHLLACADDLEVEPETDETNNCRASAGVVDVRAADLIETSLSNPPLSSAQGGSFSVTDTTRNQGNANATISQTQYHLSLDNRRGADHRLNGARFVSLLAPGASSSGTVLATIPASIPSGLYFLLACSDGIGTVLESQEGNNCRASGTRIKVGSSTGTFEVSPTETTIHAGGRLTYDFTWTVPAPSSWRDLETVDLRIRHDTDTILWIRFDEARNTLAVFDARTGTFGEGVTPGSAERVQTPFATLYVRQSSAIGTGARGPSVTLRLSVSFKRAAAGRTYVVEVAATDDLGHRDEFVQAGTIRVTRDGPQ